MAENYSFFKLSKLNVIFKCITGELGMVAYAINPLSLGRLRQGKN